MVGKQKGKPAKKAPISSHPAFPAVVALWFASLFGIGSLVLPVVLVEKFVTVTGIASLVPAAAPPLGVTARLAIALVGAVIGFAAGFMLARKLVAAQARPAAAPRRKPATLREQGEFEDMPAKRPISAHEELGSESLDQPVDAAPHAEPHPGRRRALSVTDEGGRSELLDEAPLPGGDFGGPAAIADFTASPAESHGDGAGADAEAPLELAAFEQDHAEATPGEEPVGGVQQRFAPQPLEPFGTSTLSNPGSEPAPQPFADAQQEEAVPVGAQGYDQIRQPYAVPQGSATMPSILAKQIALGRDDEDEATADAEAAPQIFASPFAPETEPAEAPAPAPFAVPHSADPAAAEPRQVFGAAPAMEPVPTMAPVPAAMPVPPFAAEAQAEPEPESAPGAAPAPIAASAPARPVGDRALGELGMTELVERFALSLERRKQGVMPAMQAKPEPVHDEAPAMPAVPEPPAEIPAAFESASPLPFARPEPSTAPEAAPAPEPVAAQAAAIPEAFERPAAEAASFAPPPAPPVPSIPAALRPLDLDSDDEDGEDMPDLSLSMAAPAPRPFSAPAAATAATAEPVPAPVAAPMAAERQEFAPPAPPAEAPAMPAPFAAPAAEEPAAVPAPFVPPAEAAALGDEDDFAEEDGEADGYSSLLDLKRPLSAGREFVRIEDEGEGGNGDIEPVVVFPGQEARRAMPAPDGPARSPAGMAYAPQPGAPRPFDSPLASKGAAPASFATPAPSPADGEPVPAGQQRADQGETEAALRAALATLQRMSGAA